MVSMFGINLKSSGCSHVPHSKSNQKIVFSFFPWSSRPSTAGGFFAGCGLLGIFLMLLNPRRRVRCSDKKQQLLARRLHETLSVRWPFLHRIIWEEVEMIGWSN